MNRVAQIAAAVLVLAIVAAACFYSGMLYGKSQTQTSVTATEFPGAPGQGGAPPAGQFGRGLAQGGAEQGGMLSGEIQEIGNGVMTIADSSGKQIEIHVTETTLIQRQASLNLADLQKGETVSVSGSQGSDGSITARSVQVIGAGAFGGRPGNNPAGNAP